MRRPLILERTGATNAGNLVTLLFDRVRPGEFWEVRELDYYNNSGESVSAQFVLVTALGTWQIRAIDTLSNGTGVGYLFGLLVREGEQIGVQAIGSADIGQFWLRASGWIHTPEREEIIVVAPATP